MPTIDCDIVIQAGHENTPDNKTGGESKWGKEIEWTPIVANEAVRVLRAAGVNVIKEDASIKSSTRKYKCKLAVFVHFDDSDTGGSGPSVGYPVDAGNEATAAQWKALYSRYFPFGSAWREDNFTEDEAKYYGYGRTSTTIAEFLIEFGDLQSERQALWMRSNLLWMGRLLAYFLSRRLGLENIQLPDAPQDGAPSNAPSAAPQLPSLHETISAAGGASPAGMSCSNGWQITGYFTASEDMYNGPLQTVHIPGEDEVKFPADFLHHVMIEGWGKTRFGWYLGWDQGWVRGTGALNALGKPLKIGSLAVDKKAIALGTTVTIPSLPAPWDKQVFVADDTGGAIQGKHLDVYCGDGPVAQKETYRITMSNMRVCT